MSSVSHILSFWLPFSFVSLCCSVPLLGRMSFGRPLLGLVEAWHREHLWETVVCLRGQIAIYVMRRAGGGGAVNGCRPAPPRAPTVYFRTARPLALRRMRGSARWGERRGREERPARWGEGEGGRLGAAWDDYRGAGDAGSSPLRLSARGGANLGRSRSPHRTRGVAAGRAAPSRRCGTAERAGLGCAATALSGPRFPRSPAVRPQREPCRTQAPFRSLALGSPSVQPGYLGGFWCISLRWKRALLETARHGSVWPAGWDLCLRAVSAPCCSCCCYLRWNPAGTARPDEPTPGL